MNRILGSLILLCCVSLSFACGGSASAPCSPACLTGWACVNGSCTPASNPSGGTASGGSTTSTTGSSTGGQCTPRCQGKCGGAANGCGGYCPASSCACGPNGDCLADGGNPVADAGSEASCTPSCAVKCAGADDGCGHPCAVGGCAGCCDADNRCQPGDSVSACGGNGEACVSCGTGPCLVEDGGVSACCQKTAVPACSTTSTQDGCGGAYAANCTTICCGAACCGSGQVCTGAQVCCTPSCEGKCPYADDGCGGVCPVPATGNPGCTYDGVPGCCDSNGVCQPGTQSSACGVDGACQACGSGKSCNEDKGNGQYVCCTPGKGCPQSCGDPNLKDECGNVCPVTQCNGCCTSAGDCAAGNTNQYCGGLGNACTSCNGSSCVPTFLAGWTCGQCQNGSTTQVACNGSCGLQAEVCVDGNWEASGGCVENCGSGCCDETQNPPACAGDTTTACGGGNGICSNCNAIYNGHDRSYGTCQAGACCMSKGAPVYSGTPASACCKGKTSCDILGNCSCQ